MLFQILFYALLWCVGGAFVLIRRTNVFGEYFTDKNETGLEVLINFILFLWALLRWPYFAWQWNEYYKSLSDEDDEGDESDDDGDAGRKQ